MLDTLRDQDVQFVIGLNAGVVFLLLISIFCLRDYWYEQISFSSTTSIGALAGTNVLGIRAIMAKRQFEKTKTDVENTVGRLLKDPRAVKAIDNLILLLSELDIQKKDIKKIAEIIRHFTEKKPLYSQKNNTDW